MTEQEKAKLAEAPASVNFYGVTARGWNMQFTLRDVDEFALMTRLGKFIIKLEEDFKIQPKPVGQQPASGAAPSQPAPPAATAPVLDGGQPDPAWCAIHNVAMKRRERDGEVWYSHKLDDGNYCNGKAKK